MRVCPVCLEVVPDGRLNDSSAAPRATAPHLPRPLPYQYMPPPRPGRPGEGTPADELLLYCNPPGPGEVLVTNSLETLTTLSRYEPLAGACWTPC